MEDLLTYSAAENAPQRLAIVDLGDPLQIALANLQHHIEASEAKKALAPCPVLAPIAHKWLMVFQNLIGNAIKYRGDDPPRIQIEAQQDRATGRSQSVTMVKVSPQDQAMKISSRSRDYTGPTFPIVGLA